MTVYIVGTKCYVCDRNPPTRTHHKIKLCDQCFENFAIKPEPVKPTPPPFHPFYPLGVKR